MPIPEWLVFLIAIAIVLIVLSYFYIMLNIISQEWIAKKIQILIDKSIVSTIRSYIHNSDYNQCLYELELIMQKLVPKSSMLMKRYNSLITLLETFLVNINCEKYSFENDKEHLKQALMGFINIYKQRNPLEQIKGVNFAILKELLDNNDEDKHKQLINQLAIELKQKDDVISDLQFSNKKSEILSKIGIILTVVFGIITIIQSII